MASIEVERQITPARLNALQVAGWPIWEKEVSVFPWTYGERETCYLLAGEVEVTPEGGEPVVIRQGDLACFPSGMRITQALRKHYQFG